MNIYYRLFWFCLWYSKNRADKFFRLREREGRGLSNSIHYSHLKLSVEEFTRHLIMVLHDFVHNEQSSYQHQYSIVSNNIVIYLMNLHIWARLLLFLIISCDLNCQGVFSFSFCMISLSCLTLLMHHVRWFSDRFNFSICSFDFVKEKYFTVFILALIAAVTYE